MLPKGLLSGMKVTGDPNVPAGELCFRTTGPMVPPDATCLCRYGCGCWRPDTDPARGWKLVGIYLSLTFYKQQRNRPNPYVKQGTTYGSEMCVADTVLKIIEEFGP